MLINGIGEGDEMPNGQAQDIEFVVEEIPHPVYVRDGDQLKTQLEVSLVEALTGFIRVLSTLDGRQLRLSNSTVIQPNQELGFAGEGMPNSKTNVKGNLIVVCKISFPRVSTQLTDEEKRRVKAALTL